MDFKIGVASYSSNKKKYFKIKDGSNVYRILPPVFDFATEGKWAVYEAIHWGYKGSDGSRKQFRCVQKKDSKTKMVKVVCAEHDKIAEQLAIKEAKKKQMEAQGVEKAQIDEFLAPLSAWLMDHNCDKKWYMNAMNEAGEIGRLAIPHKMYQALMTEIQGLVKKGIDPLDPNKGVWFDFHRTGTFNQTVHKVSVVKEMVSRDGEEFEKTKLAPLSKDVLDRLKTEAWNLKDMFRTLSPDQITIMVKSGGDTSVVDAVFNGGDVKNVNPEPPDEDEPDSGESAVAPKVEPVKESEVVKAAKEEKAKPASTAPLSDEDFMKKFKKSK